MKFWISAKANKSLFYCLNSAIIRMCEAGVNIKAMQEILGHADAETTMDIYAEVTTDLKRSELIDFEEYFRRKNITATI